MRLYTLSFGGCERNSVRPMEVGELECVSCVVDDLMSEEEFRCKPCDVNSGEAEEIIEVDGRDADEDEESGMRKTVKIQPGYADESRT